MSDFNDIKSFNQIMKGLNKSTASKNTTEQSEELAKKLLAQGIAKSMMEAREKAKSMIGTERSVLEDEHEKAQRNTTYNDPRNNAQYNPYRAAMIQELRQKAMQKETRPINIQSEFQTPGFEAKNGSQGLPRAVIRERKDE